MHNSDLINNSNQENVYIFNIVINKYSIFVRKNVLSRKHYVFTIPKGVQWNLLITLTCLINGNQKFDPLALVFVDKVEHLILVLLCKANLEYKEVCASGWLKPISTLPTLVFYVLHSRFGFALEEVYL